VLQHSFLNSLELKVAPGNAALVVVDVQNDFCDDGGVFGKAGYDLSMVRKAIPKIKALVDGARSAGVPVIFVQAIYDPVFLPPAWYERNARLGFEVSRCLSGSWGADFHGIKPLEGETIIRKHRYSAFVGTDLDLVLRSQQIQSLIVAGVATNICVESTSRDAFMQDYYVTLAEDASAAYNQEQHDATLTNIKVGFGIVATVQEIMAAWGAPAGNK
jgi:ureidoacrylate peracid hydrolase